MFYDEWYYSVIRELAVYSRWDEDYHRLGALVVPPISAEKAKKAVATLITIGLLKRNPDGTYQQSSKVITGDDAPPVALKKLKKDFMLKAVDSEEKFDRPYKYSSSVTLSMSMESFEKAKKLIDSVRRELLVMAMDDPKVEKVFQANFQMFPLSEQFESCRGGAQDE